MILNQFLEDRMLPGLNEIEQKQFLLNIPTYVQLQDKKVYSSLSEIIKKWRNSSEKINDLTKFTLETEMR